MSEITLCPPLPTGIPGMTSRYTECGFYATTSAGFPRRKSPKLARRRGQARVGTASTFAGADQYLAAGDSRRRHLKVVCDPVPGLKPRVLVVEVVAFAGGEGDADQVLNGPSDGLGGDAHAGERCVHHDSAPDVVLPDRRFMVTESVFEIAYAFFVDVEDDSSCLHRSTPFVGFMGNESSGQTLQRPHSEGNKDGGSGNAGQYQQPPRWHSG